MKLVAARSWASGGRAVFHSQLPVSIRLNRSFFPADLITVRSRGRTHLDGVTVQEAALDDVFKRPEGGGGPLRRLGPTDSIDVFVRADPSGAVEYPPLRHASFISVRRGVPGILWVTWERVNGRESPGEVCIVWTYQDRADGKAPLMATGAACRVISQYVQQLSQPVTGALLGIRRRVPEMRRGDIRRRIRAERERDSAMGKHPNSWIQSLAVRGFRGFRDEAVLQLAQPNGREGSGLTLVVGANNTGKSTIWESFDAIARKMKSDVSFSEGRRNRATLDGIRICLTRQDGYKYLLESRSANTSETKAKWMPVDPGGPLEIVSVPSRRQFQATFGRGGNSDRDWMTDHTDFTRYRQTDQFTGRLFDLHNNDASKAKFDTLMTEVLGESLDWTIELGDGQYHQSYYLKVTTGNSVNHNSEGLGDGIISLLYILNALFDSEPNTLLVFDEPELSLHPQLLRRMSRVLARFAKDRQIIVFTHSPILVSWDDIEAGAQVARVYKRDADSKIAQVSRETIHEVSEARRDWRNPHRLGVDANEALFLDDGVIVVEGQEDAVLLPRAFELAGVELAGKIFGWGSGGAHNVVRIVRLLKELDFARVAVIVDNNVPEVVADIRARHSDVMVAEIPAADIRDKPSSSQRPEVKGLLSKNGSVMHDDLRTDATVVFAAVTAYMKTGATPMEREGRI